MSHFRLLLWLRWKYLWRATPARRVSFVIGFVFSTIAAVGVGAMVFAWVHTSRRNWPDLTGEFIALGFMLIYAGWLYLCSLSDLYDPQRLAPYPIRPRTLFWGSCAASVIGFTPLFGIGIWAGLTLGWPAPLPLAAWRSALLLVFLAHLVFLSRLIRLTFLEFLTSRRWRDLAVLLSVLIGGGFYAFFQLMQLEQFQNALQLVVAAARERVFSRFLLPFPSGWFARAWLADGPGAMTAAVAFIGVTAALVVLGGKIENRLAFSKPVFARAPRRKAGAPRPFLRGAVARVGRLFGADVAAIARKELTVLRRDPLIRTQLLTNLFWLFPVVIGPALAMRRGGPAPHLPDVLGGALLFYELIFLLNLLGTDGLALRALALLPVQRLRILFGKHVCYAAVFLPVNVAVLIVVTRVFGNAARLPRDLAYHAAAFVVLVGAGSLVSVYTPQRLVIPGQRRSRTVEHEGCARAFYRSLTMMATLLLLSPVALARYVLANLGPGLEAVLIVGSLGYAAALYGISLALAGRAFTAREERLVEFFARS